MLRIPVISSTDQEWYPPFFGVLCGEVDITVPSVDLFDERHYFLAFDFNPSVIHLYPLVLK